MSINLPLARYRFCFKADDNILLPPYSGSSWRGLFGHQLKQTVCVTRERNCQECLLWRSCVYTYLFETPPAIDADMMKKYPAAPHPYVIQPDAFQQRHVSKGELLHFDLTLVAKANQHLPYVIHTFQQAGMRGIGSQRGRFGLQEVLQYRGSDNWEKIYEAQGKLCAFAAESPVIPVLPKGEVRLKFLTPCRLRVKNHYIGARELKFSFLIANLLRRLSSLSYFHNDEELSLDFARLVKASQAVEFLDSNLIWKDWTRYSSRQQSSLKMGGFIGDVRLNADDLGDFWELLYLGQYLNLGKGSVMGLGRYSLSFDV